jgi:hypothetical protein
MEQSIITECTFKYRHNNGGQNHSGMTANASFYNFSEFKYFGNILSTTGITIKRARKIKTRNMFTFPNRKKQNYISTCSLYFGMSAEGQNCEASRDSRS